MKNEYEKAISDLSNSILLDPKNTFSYSYRGYALAIKGEYNKAISDFNAVIRIDPKSNQGYNDLAWLLATCSQQSFRDGKKAVLLAQKACELSKEQASIYMDTLAAAYAESGDFDSAVSSELKYLTTLNLPENKSSEANSRLLLYKSHKPYYH